ncbi:MAG TPA: hypothetical protein DCQ83_05435 [Fibrobacteres bacterium]|jgi:hypothetical protein|nr:hypothetical protein [Fibrobacterota bacterium]
MFSARPILAACLIASSAFAVDITFFSVSDPHYGQTGAPSSGTGITQKDTSRARMPGILNALPGTTYPTAAGGGTIAEPRAVLVVGDLIEMIDSALWARYTADYGVTGDKKLRFPTLEALGNHDFYTTGTIKDTLYLVDRMRQRNALRKLGLTAMDSTEYHYSWDWDGVHFINLNLYAGSTELGYSGYRPMNALAFLQKDLAENVGNSGRPVFIMEHYPVNDNTYFPQALRTPFYNAILNYNVIGILHGHSHAQAIYTWNNNNMGTKTFDIYDDGTVMDGDIMVFHITDGRMVATHRSFVGTGTSGNGAQQWSTLIKDKTISMGTATRITNAQGERMGLFTVEGLSLRFPASARQLEIVDLQGRLVQRLTVRNERVDWDRRDPQNHKVTPGVYFLKVAGKPRAFGKLALR